MMCGLDTSLLRKFSQGYSLSQITKRVKLLTQGRIGASSLGSGFFRGGVFFFVWEETLLRDLVSMLYLVQIFREENRWVWEGSNEGVYLV